MSLRIWLNLSYRLKSTTEQNKITKRNISNNNLVDVVHLDTSFNGVGNDIIHNIR